MPTTIDTEAVKRLADEGAQLVEVLPKDAFDREHLPGATCIPLVDMTEASTLGLDRDRPIVVYCYDLQCDLSPRAAAWLEELGFTEVYDYAASKVAWLAYGLPSEGSIKPTHRAGGRLRPASDPFSPDDTVGGLGAVFDREPVAVVAVDGFVVGVVRPEVLDLPPDTPLRSVLQPGPPSVRPSIPIDELARSMDQDGQRWVLVTRLDGSYLGTIRREDLDGDR